MVVRGRKFTEIDGLLAGSYQNSITNALSNNGNPLSKGKNVDVNSIEQADNDTLERARLDKGNDDKSEYSAQHNVKRATDELIKTRDAILLSNEHAKQAHELGDAITAAEFPKYICEMSYSPKYAEENGTLEQAILDNTEEEYTATRDLAENIALATEDIVDTRAALIVKNSNAANIHASGNSIPSANFPEYINQMITPDMCPVPEPKNPAVDAVDGWTDIRRVMDNAPLLYDSSNNEYKAAAVTLLFDCKATTVFSQYSSCFGNGYQSAIWVTSDGSRYTSTEISGQVTHTWNEAQDVSCAQGYKTRYVITYLRNIPSSYITFDNYDYIWSTNNNALWVHLDNFEVRTVTNNSTLTDSNYNMTPLEMITCGANARGTANTVFRIGIMKDLRHIELPEGMTKITQQSFEMLDMRGGLKSLKIPSTVTEVGMLSMTGITPDTFVMPKNLTTVSSAQGMISYYNVVGEVINQNGGTIVGGIKQLHFPVFPNTDIAMQVMNRGSFTNAISTSLRAVTCDSGFNIRYLVDFGRCIHLSKSAITNFGNNLASRVGMTAGTITFGATNIAKLSAAEKTIFTNKNYNIN